MAITNSIGATKKHIELAVMDEEFITEADAIKQNGDDSERRDDLYKRYGFSGDDFRSVFVWGQIWIPPFVNKTHFPRGQLTYDEKHNKFVAIFEPTIRQEELDKLWPATKFLKRKLGIVTKDRVRSPGLDRSLLFYAVFKMKRDGAKWDDVFKAYENGQLQYNGNKVPPVEEIVTKIELQKAYSRVYRSSM